MCHPCQEMAQLSQIPQIENGKPDFSPTFQKVELRNSTFFQLFSVLMWIIVSPNGQCGL